MSEPIDINSIQNRIDNANLIANKVYYTSICNKTKTIIIEFARSYFVFIVGCNELTAYSLSTTKFKHFKYVSQIYDFLKVKDIKQIHEFDGELHYTEIRKLVNYK